MRQIRFKARAVKTNEWVEGYYAIIHAPRYGDENELIGFDEFPSINEVSPLYDSDHWVDVYPQTLCQMTDMTDADGLPIWENDRVRLTPIGRPGTPHDGEVVWMQTCFGIEDELGHTAPICQLRPHFTIEVVGNKFEGV